MAGYFQNTDVENIKRVLTYLLMPDAIDKLILNQRTTMEDLRMTSGKLQGFNHILPELTKDRPRIIRRFCGKSPEQRAIIQQWLQYALINLRGKMTTEYVLKELDNALVYLTFFGGHSVTLVDPLIYLRLYPIFVDMTLFDKEKKYPHLSRWFALIQTDDNLRKENKMVVFSKTPLFKGYYARPGL